MPHARVAYAGSVDFQYTSEQVQLRKAVREFAEAEIAPHVMEWDEAQVFPLEVIKKLGALGYMGSIFPEELGGAGLGYIEYAIIIEELSRVDGSVGIIVAAHTSLCSNHIFKAGTDEQRRKYIPRLASGEWIGCWSLTEPEAGSDAAGTRTTAAPDGDCWVLNGAKTFTTNAHYADVCVAMAVTDRAAAQHGISAFVIDSGTPGFRLGKKENKLGLRASATGEVIFDNCRLPAGHLLGKRGRRLRGQPQGAGRRPHLHRRAGAWDGAGRLRCRAALLQAAPAVRPLHLGIPDDPEQAGRYGHRDRRRPPADLPRRLDAGPWAARHQGIRHGQAVRLRSGRAHRQRGRCKSTAATASSKTTRPRSIYRDVKLCTIGEGTSEIQRLVIARQLLKSV